MPRKGDYIYKRKGSQNWYVRIQYPEWLQAIEGKRKIELSLGTGDRTEAELLAMDYIRKHKRRLFDRRQFESSRTRHEVRERMYEPDTMHRNADGTTIVASDKEIKFFDESGALVRTEPNGRVVVSHINPAPHELREFAPYQYKTPDRDDVFIDNWIEHKSINKHIESEARNTWDRFKLIVSGRPLTKCKREDGRSLAKLLLSEGNKSATVNKKIGHLRAAVNLAIADGRLEKNPFIDAVPKLDDSVKRLPLDDTDMETIKNNLHSLSSSDQLLWKILACTGMRISEAFQIDEEFSINGLRAVRVGTKTESSERYVPIPTALLSQIPAKINRRLFEGDTETTNKRIRYILRKHQISHDVKYNTGDKRKVVHSLRHRAKQRLRDMGCPEAIQYEILGHEVKTVAAGYGTGYPIPVLLKYIDLIGW